MSEWEPRFWGKVEKTAGCWQWLAHKGHDGYGRFKLNGRAYLAHRLAYELASGPIPEGLQIDHTCHARSCVNPSHLRAVTNKQNKENLSGPQRNGVSGVRGVFWNKGSNRWRASVRHNGVHHHLGYFRSIAEAEKVVIAKRNKLFTHNDLDRRAA
jgi:hypothetical protein